MAWKNIIQRSHWISRSNRFVLDGLKLRSPIGHAPCVHILNWESSGFSFNPHRHFASLKSDPVKPIKETVREESTATVVASDAVKPDENTIEKVKKPGLRDMLKKYGVPFFVWYTSLYFTTGACIYVAIESGLVGGGDVIEWVRQTGFSPDIVDKINPKYGNIGAAIVINECLEIVRFPFAIATIPTIFKTWKKFSEKKKTDETL